MYRTRGTKRIYREKKNERKKWWCASKGRARYTRAKHSTEVFSRITQSRYKRHITREHMVWRVCISKVAERSHGCSGEIQCLAMTFVRAKLFRPNKRLSRNASFKLNKSASERRPSPSGELLAKQCPTFSVLVLAILPSVWLSVSRSSMHIPFLTYICMYSRSSTDSTYKVTVYLGKKYQF